MNWNRIEGDWKLFRGHVKEQWARLTDEQLDLIAGKREQLAGRIQKAYGISKDATEKQITEWQRQMKAGSKGTKRP